MMRLPMTRPLRHTLAALGASVMVAAPAGASAGTSAGADGMSQPYAPLPSTIAPPAPTQPVGTDEDGFPVWADGLLAPAPLPPAPVDATRIDARLKGYVLGFKVIDARYDGWIGADSYAVRARLGTAGLGALLRKLDVWAVTEGRWDANGLHPTYHLQQNTDKKRRRVEMRYDYGARSVDVSVIPPNGSQGVPPASAPERFGADDTVSTFLNLMVRRPLLGLPTCGGAVEVFDSKQRYNLRLAERDFDADGKSGGYRGPLRECEVFYEPVSGFDPEDLPDAEEGSTPVRMRVGELDGFDVPLRFSYRISGFRAVIKTDRITLTRPDGTVVELD